VDPLRVGLIGFGAIGRAVAERLALGEAGPARVCAVLVRHPDRIPAEARARHPDVTFTSELGPFLETKPDWAVEAAGHEALRQWGPPTLNGRVNLIALSAGALADDAFRVELEDSASRAGCRVLVPSGGMGALDLLSSAALDRLDAVRLTTRKPPRALLPADEAEAVMRSGKARLLFDGTAREAAPRFPENLNICSALALAGIGLDRTRVRVYADPAVSRNTHRISARGATGSYQLTLRHVPSENPKTGRVVALSVVKALRNLTSPFVVGG
jgi:aspartate dehydrogenase